MKSAKYSVKHGMVEAYKKSRGLVIWNSAGYSGYEYIELAYERLLYVGKWNGYQYNTWWIVDKNGKIIEEGECARPIYNRDDVMCRLILDKI